MQGPSDEAPPTGYFACPTCAQAVVVNASRDEQIVACPACRNEFTVPAADVEEPDAGDRRDELDALRIRQLATARRAAYRARSYAIIAAAVCLVAGGQFVWTIGRSRVAHVLLAAVALVGFAYFARLARRLHEETRESSLTEPTSPPDFTGLGDGPDAWKKLDDVS